jgi:anti-anti-sigma factor
VRETSVRGDDVALSFEICVEEQDNRILFTLRGELDLAAVPAVRESFSVVPWSRRPSMIVDLHDLTFLDATGLTVLIAAGRDARAAGRPLAMVPGPPNVQRVFVLTETLELFDWIDPPS